VGAGRRRKEIDRLGAFNVREEVRVDPVFENLLLTVWCRERNFFCGLSAKFGERPAWIALGKALPRVISLSLSNMRFEFSGNV